jgi:hypothetical protein
MEDGQHVNHFFNDSIGDQVGSSGNRYLSGSCHAADSAGVGHAGSAKDCVMNAMNGSLCRSGTSIGDEIEDALELVYGGHGPTDFQTFSSIASRFMAFPRGFPLTFSRAQESIILPTSS